MGGIPGITPQVWPGKNNHTNSTVNSDPLKPLFLVCIFRFFFNLSVSQYLAPMSQLTPQCSGAKPVMSHVTSTGLKSINHSGTRIYEYHQDIRYATIVLH